MANTKAGPLGGGSGSDAAPPGFLSKDLAYVLNGKELIRKSGDMKTEENKKEDMDMMKAFFPEQNI